MDRVGGIRAATSITPASSTSPRLSMTVNCCQYLEFRLACHQR